METFSTISKGIQKLLWSRSHMVHDDIAYAARTRCIFTFFSGVFSLTILIFAASMKTKHFFGSDCLCIKKGISFLEMWQHLMTADILFSLPVVWFLGEKPCGGQTLLRVDWQRKKKTTLVKANYTPLQASAYTCNSGVLVCEYMKQGLEHRRNKWVQLSSPV